MNVPFSPPAAPVRWRGQIWPLLVAFAMLWLLAWQLREVSPEAVLAALASLDASQWLLALLATAWSFAALGRYEMVLHEALGTGVARRRARHAGLRAIALSQVLGSGTVTGALLRWRLLPGLPLAGALRLSALMSVTFLGALCCLVSLALWTTGATDLPGQGYLRPLALCGLLALLGLPLLAARSAPLSRLLGGLRPGHLPRLLLWTALDCAGAALALHAVLPEAAPGPLTIGCAYLVALSAGLLSLSPGGLGAFDLALLALLPEVPEAELLAALIAFRAIYYVLPALLSLPAVLRPPPPVAELRRLTGPALEARLANAPCPEWGLARQGARVCVMGAGAAWLLRPAPGLLATIGAPAGSADLRALREAALAEDRGIALYKAPPRLAARARAAGWSVLRIGAVAELDPARWTPEGPRRRQLRRKLRQAADAGLRIETTATPPLAEMAALADRWAARNGGERGFSMGVFEAGYLRRQRVLLAFAGDRLVAFVSFHCLPGAWTLDLVRHDDAPQGTMHALVAAAIAQARSEGVRRLSLAAVPGLPGWPRLDRRLPKGLAQFKAAVGPDWRPIYLCTPRPWHLPIALASLAFEIRWGHRLRTDRQAQTRRLAARIVAIRS